MEAINIECAPGLRETYSITPSAAQHFAESSAPSIDLASQFSYLQAFTAAEIKEATDSFSREARIGEGGFGTVYRGELNGMPVAIKKLSPQSLQVRRLYLHAHNILVEFTLVLGFYLMLLACLLAFLEH